MIIQELLQINSIVQEIKTRYEQVQGNREQCNYLMKEIDILTKFLKELHSSIENQELCKEPLKELYTTVKNVLNYINKYTNSNFYRQIVNVVYANKHAGELAEIHQRLSDNMATLSHIFNINGISILIENSDNQMQMQEAILADTRELKNLLTTNSVYSPMHPHSSLLTTESVIENYRETLERLVYFNNPLNYNPFRDALLETSVGKFLLESEIMQMEQYINNADQNGLDQLFRSIARRQNISIDDLNTELVEYFEKYYPNDADVDLATIVSRAIEQAADTSLKKYKEENVDFFKGKMFIFRHENTESVDNIDVCGEILTYKKEGISWRQTSEFIVREGTGQQFKIDFDRIYHDTGMMRIYRQGVQDLGRHLTHPIFTPRPYLVEIQSKDINMSVFSPGKYWLTRVKNANKEDIKKQFSDFSGWIWNLTNNVTITDHNEYFTLIHETLPKNKYFVYFNTYSDNELSLVDYSQVSTCNRYDRQTFMKQLSQIYTIQYDECIFFNKNDPNEPAVQVKLDKIQIKQKILDANEIRWEKLQKIEKLRVDIVTLLSFQDKQLFVDEVLDQLIFHHFNALPEETFIDDWMQRISVDIQEKFNELFATYAEVTDYQSLKRAEVVINFVLEANSVKLLKTRKDVLPALEVMDRLTKAREYLDELQDEEGGKDLILFLGETGVGKSTSVNYFTGIELSLDDTGPIRSVRLKNPLEHEESAAIALFMSISETTYVKGHEIKKDKKGKRRWLLESFGNEAADIDFDRLRLCDCPGFNDTRGAKYDLSAALSISRAVKQARSLKAIVLVVSYQDFFSGKGRSIIDTFDKLEDMLVGGFEDRDICQSIYLIISHTNNPSQNKKDFDALIKKYVSESTRGILDEAAENRAKIWRFIERLHSTRRTLFIDVTNRDHKKQWLSGIAQKKHVGIPKEKFLDALDIDHIQRKFADSVENALFIWGKLIIKRYFEDIPLELEDFKNNIERKNTEIGILNQKITELRELIITNQDKQKAFEAERDELQTYDQNSYEVLAVKYRKKLAASTNQEIKARENEIFVLEQELEHMKQIEEPSFVERKDRFNIKIDEIIQAIVNLENEKLHLSTGSATLQINEPGTGFMNYKPESTIRVGQLKNGKRSEALAEVRAWTDADFVEGTIKNYRAEDYEGSLESNVLIRKGYRVVPSDPVQRDAFMQERRVNTNHGEYVAVLEGEQIGMSSNYLPKASPDGKSMVYLITSYWKAKRDLPWFKIVHTMPKIDINEQAIANKDAEITLKKAELHALIGYTLVFQLDLKTDKPNAGEIYVSSEGNRLKYSVVSPEGFLFTNYIDVKKLNELGINNIPKTTSEYFMSLRAILRITTSRNHTKTTELEKEEQILKRRIQTNGDNRKRLKTEIDDIRRRQFQDSIPEWIEQYNHMIEDCAKKIEQAEKTIIKYEKGSLKDTEGEESILEKRNLILIKQRQQKNVMAEKIRLAILIKTQEKMITSLKEFAKEAYASDTDINEAIQRRKKLSEGSSSDLEKECMEYINFYENHFEDLLKSCEDDLNTSSLIVLHDLLKESEVKKSQKVTPDNTNDSISSLDYDNVFIEKLSKNQAPVFRLLGENKDTFFNNCNQYLSSKILKISSETIEKSTYTENKSNIF